LRLPHGWLVIQRILNTLLQSGIYKQTVIGRLRAQGLNKEQERNNSKGFLHNFFGSRSGQAGAIDTLQIRGEVQSKVKLNKTDLFSQARRYTLSSLRIRPKSKPSSRRLRAYADAHCKNFVKSNFSTQRFLDGTGYCL
jgi:hypothetical protein